MAIEEEHVVAGVEDVRRIVRASKVNDELRFFIGPDASLIESHRMWPMLRVQVGGHGLVCNPDVLVHKEAALDFVERKLGQLRRWRADAEKKLASVNQKLQELHHVLEGGGPGFRREYSPHGYDGIFPYIDIDKTMDSDDLEEHISNLTDLILQESPRSPGEDGTYRSVDQCDEREREEQLDLARFNVSYLDVKKEALSVLSAHLAQAILDLEEEFLTKPTYLGGGDGDFVRFKDVNMLDRDRGEDVYR